MCRQFHLIPLLSDAAAVEQRTRQRRHIMKPPRRFSKILLYQGLGFTAIMALSWVEALLDLPALILRDHPGFPQPIWTCALQSLLILTVWFLVAASTRRVWERLQKLEGFLHVCSWCRQIDYKEHWMPFEEFLNQSFDTPTSHGICPKCMKEQLASMERAKARKEQEADLQATSKTFGG